MARPAGYLHERGREVELELPRTISSNGHRGIWTREYQVATATPSPKVLLYWPSRNLKRNKGTKSFWNVCMYIFCFYFSCHVWSLLISVMDSLLRSHHKSRWTVDPVHFDCDGILGQGHPWNAASSFAGKGGEFYREHITVIPWARVGYEVIK